MATPIQVTFDCAEPARLAAFWASALGYVLQPPPAGHETWEDALRAWGVPEDRWDSRSAVVDPDGGGPRLLFNKVPEQKAEKNRLHLDVNVGGPLGTPADERRRRVDEEVARLVAAGGSAVRPYEELGEYWVLMRDPEGNEFCVQ